MEQNYYDVYGAMYGERYAYRKTAAAIGTAFLLMTLLPLAIGFGFGLARGRLADAVLWLQSDAYGQLLLQITSSTLMFLLPYGIAVKMQGRTLRGTIDFARPARDRFLPVILVGLSLCMAANVIGGAVTQFLSNLGLTSEMSDLPLPTGPSGVLLAVLTIAVEPALMEEFAMRGVVLGSLRKYGDGQAILVSAILFALMHGNLEQIPFAFLVGIVLGAVCVKTGSIWTSIAIHFLNNFLSLLLMYFETCAPLPAPASDALQILAMLAVFFLGFVGLRMLSGREGDLFSFPTQPAPRKPYLRWFFSTGTVIAGVVIMGLQAVVLIVLNLLANAGYVVLGV